MSLTKDRKMEGKFMLTICGFSSSLKLFIIFKKYGFFYYNCVYLH